jgi:hypothetical protein
MANTKYAKGLFTPKHPEKYVGKGSILYRSSWELAFFTFCDNHPSVLQWASECIRIPYRNPLSGKNTTYVPDLFIVYQDSKGQNHVELIEIKPSKETTMEAAKSRRDKLSVALNQAKWGAAYQWAASKGMKFRVVTEKDLFAGTK